MRNTIFLSVAAAYLESRVLYAIEVEGVDVSAVAASVYMAPNSLDYSGYPDCRPEFYEKMRQALKLGSKLWIEYRVPIRVETADHQPLEGRDCRSRSEARGPSGAHLELLQCRRCALRFMRQLRPARQGVRRGEHHGPATRSPRLCLTVVGAIQRQFSLAYDTQTRSAEGPHGLIHRLRR